MTMDEIKNKINFKKHQIEKKIKKMRTKFKTNTDQMTVEYLKALHK